MLMQWRDLMDSDEMDTEPLTSSAKVKDKVQWILYAGLDDDVDAVELFDSGYQRTRAVRMLRDYVDHPSADTLVEKRAREAITALEEVMDDA